MAVCVLVLLGCGASPPAPVAPLVASTSRSDRESTRPDALSCAVPPSNGDDEPAVPMTCGILLNSGCEDEACVHERETEEREPEVPLDARERGTLAAVDREIRAGEYDEALRLLEVQFGDAEDIQDALNNRPLAYRGLALLRIAERMETYVRDQEDPTDAIEHRASFLEEAFIAFETVATEAHDPNRRARAYFHLALTHRAIRGPIVASTPDDPEFSDQYERALRASLCLRDNETVQTALVEALLVAPRIASDPRAPLARLREAARLAAEGSDEARRARARVAEALQQSEAEPGLRAVTLEEPIALENFCAESEADCSTLQDDGSGLRFRSECERSATPDGDADWECVTYAFLPVGDAWALHPIPVGDDDDAPRVVRIDAPCPLIQLHDSICRLGEDPACFTPRGGAHRFAAGGTVEFAPSGAFRVTREVDDASACVDPVSLCGG